MTRWTCDACGESPDDGWGACWGCRDLRPLGNGWPDGDTLLLLYPGDTQVDASQRARVHAGQLGSLGYGIVATSWGEERPDTASALFAAHLEEAHRVGTLLVTYRRSASG